jgi:hypothetical protein
LNLNFQFWNSGSESQMATPKQMNLLPFASHSEAETEVSGRTFLQLQNAMEVWEEEIVWHNIQEKMGVQRERKCHGASRWAWSSETDITQVQRARVAWEALLWHITAALSLLLFPTMLLPPAPFPKLQKTSLHLQS